MGMMDDRKGPTGGVQIAQAGPPLQPADRETELGRLKPEDRAGVEEALKRYHHGNPNWRQNDDRYRDEAAKARDKGIKEWAEGTAPGSQAPGLKDLGQKREEFLGRWGKMMQGNEATPPPAMDGFEGRGGFEYPGTTPPKQK